MPRSRSTGVRLRQAVLVARDLEPAYDRLREALGLGEPFRDPGVGMFGLHNVVCALGEDFLEVVSPTQEGTAAGRHLERRGEGGYMLIFQLDDLASARERAQALGVRTVWSVDIDDISASHLSVPDPNSVAARWAEVLGLEPDGTTLRLDRGQHVAFERGDEGLTEIAVELPGGASEPLAFGAARVVPV
jgi:hypothetical protein